MSKILVVDDESSMRELLEIMLQKEGYNVVCADRRTTALATLEREPFDLVVTDLRLPDGDGLEILQRAKELSPGIVVVMMTAYGTTQTAVSALKLGAHDYLTKPFDIDELRIVVRGALDKRRLEEENLLLKAEFRSRHGLDRIVGVSPAMSAVLDVVRSVAPTGSTVLITGESGTGKELIAKAIHALSPRREASFVSVNCGALPETLLESELFGHVRGAFTDAHQNRKGLFEAAHSGTLFLDEISETPLSMQVKLLRALQDKRIRRLGATEEIAMDVRVVAATNRPPEELISEGRLRKDLYYRLSVIPLHVPPLRERPEDIPVLAEHFLTRYSKEMGKVVARISLEAMMRLREYSWPGNVRELENVIERAVALESTPVILPERLSLSLVGKDASSSKHELPPNMQLDEYIRSIEKSLVASALDQSKGDRSLASRLLGISARSLRYLIQKHELGSQA